jgi:hypothetical protein
MENGFEWPGLLSALVLAQHADQHDPEHPVLLAVDQELGEGAAPSVRAPHNLGEPEAGRYVRIDQAARQIGIRC